MIEKPLSKTEQIELYRMFASQQIEADRRANNKLQAIECEIWLLTNGVPY